MEEPINACGKVVRNSSPLNVLVHVSILFYSYISGDFIMSKFEELKDLVTGLEGDISQFYGKKNKAAGTRVRKAMQEVKKMAQDIRVEVQEMKNK